MVAVRSLSAGLRYDVKGRLQQTEEGQVFEESPWDFFVTGKLLRQGHLEEVGAVLEASEPQIEVIDVPDIMDLGSLENLTVVELRSLCSDNDLPASGKKAALIARLLGEEE